MKCTRARNLLVEYNENTLTGRKMRAVERHLSDCPLCRDELSSIRRVRGRLLSLREPEQGPEFWEAFKGKLSEKLILEEGPAARRPLWLTARPLTAAAAAMILITLSIAVSFRLRERPAARNESPRTSAGLIETGSDLWETDIFDSYANGQLKITLAGLSAEDIQRLNENLPLLAEEGRQASSEEVILDGVYEQGMYDSLDELTSAECDELFEKLEAI